MKGIILAGGTGSRLYPITKGVSKQLLPVYDKPMIYYPLSTLMLAGITEILVITTPDDQPIFERLLKDGSHLGLEISYAEQAKPNGIAEALIIGADFLDGEGCALILGDNIFYGHGLSGLLREAASRKDGATIFCSQVSDPERYGVVTFDDDDTPVEIIEKPKVPKSRFAVTGVYFYDSTAVERAQKLVPSDRKELEITGLNQSYLEEGKVNAVCLGRGFTWFDTGTFDSLLQASDFVQSLEKRQGLKVGCPEEMAYRLGLISAEDLKKLAKSLKKSGYGDYLVTVSKSKPGI